jgi:hypothetical protein
LACDPEGEDETEVGPVATPPHGFAVENGRLFLRLPDGADPNGEPVLLSSPSWNYGPGARSIFRVEHSPYVILDGLRIEGSIISQKPATQLVESRVGMRS